MTTTTIGRFRLVTFAWCAAAYLLVVLRIYDHDSTIKFAQMLIPNEGPLMDDAASSSSRVKSQKNDISTSTMMLDELVQDYRRKHHAIIIPFRNRTKHHLEGFIKYMGPYMKRNFPNDDFSLFFMEQVVAVADADDDSQLFLFNSRGFLCNAGLTEIYKCSPATHCVSIHNVDFIPTLDGVQYSSCDSPIQLGGGSSKQLGHHTTKPSSSTPYDPTAANGDSIVVSNMHMIHWRTVNGMSNDYEWGSAGGVDDDLYYRLLHNNLLVGISTNSDPKHKPEIMRSPERKGIFHKLELTTTDENSKQTTTALEKQENEGEEDRLLRKDERHQKYYEHNMCLLEWMSQKSDRWKNDGLNDVDYKVMGDTKIQNVDGSNDFFEIHHIQVKAQGVSLQDTKCIPPEKKLDDVNTPEAASSESFKSSQLADPSTSTTSTTRETQVVWKSKEELGVKLDRDFEGAINGENASTLGHGGGIQLSLEHPPYIYQEEMWDGAPIVVPEFKLIFFTVPKIACSVFKQLFRRIAGQTNWNKVEPHDPKKNQLRYLYHYPPDNATEMLTSKEWTRAIFLRDPKERVLSAYLDKAWRDGASYVKDICCGTNTECYKASKASFSSFLQVAHACPDPHWHPLSRRIEAQFWPYLDFIGRMENIKSDATKLLKRVGAWEQYGASGWGHSGKEAIFHSATVGHEQKADTQLRKFYTKETEVMVEELMAEDYNNPLFGFNITATRLFP